MVLPAAGQALRIRQQSGEGAYYRSRFVDVQNNVILFERPVDADGKGMIPSDNLQIWMEYHAQDGALCSFQTSFLRTDDSLAYWIAERPPTENIRREQRREFVRVDVDLPVRLEYPFGGMARVLDVRSKDISGGGLGLWLPEQTHLSPGQLVTTRFTLPKDQFTVDCQCVVVRVGDPNDEGYRIGSMMYQGIREAIRQRIIQFTFWRQRYLLEMFGNGALSTRKR